MPPLARVVGSQMWDGTNLFPVVDAEFSLNFSTPGSSIVTIQSTTTGLGQYRSLHCYAELQGSTGDVYDLVMQCSDSGVVWREYARWPTIAAGAAAVRYYWAVSRFGQRTAIQTIAASGAPAAPVLAANTVIGGDWGDRVRLIIYPGAATTAGASQVMKIIASPGPLNCL